VAGEFLDGGFFFIVKDIADVVGEVSEGHGGVGVGVCDGGDALYSAFGGLP